VRRSAAAAGRRRLLPVLMGPVLMGLALMGLALAVSPALAQSAAPAGGAPAAATGAPAAGVGDVQISQQAYAIASELRCPVCTAESVADSSAQISVEMRSLIQRQLDAGRSKAQIIAYFRQRYGDWILLDPPKQGVHLLVWLLPALALLAGLAALGLLFRRWRAAAEATPQADAAALARVREALQAAPLGAAANGGPPAAGGAPGGRHGGAGGGPDMNSGTGSSAGAGSGESAPAADADGEAPG